MPSPPGTPEKNRTTAGKSKIDYDYDYDYDYEHEHEHEHEHEQGSWRPAVNAAVRRGG